MQVVRSPTDRSRSEVAPDKGLLRNKVRILKRPCCLRTPCENGPLLNHKSTAIMLNLVRWLVTPDGASHYSLTTWTRLQAWPQILLTRRPVRGSRPVAFASKNRLDCDRVFGVGFTG